MKIDKKNYKHWLYLLRSAVAILLTLPFSFAHRRKRVVLYGHKLNGNLLALYDYLLEYRPDVETYYLTMDPDYLQELRGSGVQVLYMGYLKDMLVVSKTKAIISDHGLHTLRIYLWLTSIKFVDVWHGIPYKGFDESSFAHLHKHDEVWVSSEYMRDIYIERYGFDAERVKVTGYGRVDRLVLGDYDRKALLKKYQLEDRKTVLVAPTWAQDDKGRSIVPFGASLEDFFGTLEEVGKNTDSTIVFRAHLNTGDTVNPGEYEHIKIMPYSRHHIAEEFLYISDILVTDWSSIAFDYLTLRRPTIFLDVPVPFAKGLTLGREHRFGEVVSSLGELSNYMNKYIENPQEFQNKYASNMDATTEVAYGSTLDGRAIDRYLKNLDKILL